MSRSPPPPPPPPWIIYSVGNVSASRKAFEKRSRTTMKTNFHEIDFFNFFDIFFIFFLRSCTHIHYYYVVKVPFTSTCLKSKHIRAQDQSLKRTAGLGGAVPPPPSHFDDKLAIKLAPPHTRWQQTQTLLLFGKNLKVSHFQNCNMSMCVCVSSSSNEKIVQ